MENDFDYYFMRRKNDQPYPFVKITREEYKENGALKLVHLEFNNPIPSNYVMADFLCGPKDVVSKRIADIIRSFQTKGVGFIPTELLDNKGNIIDDYIIIFVDGNTFEAMDKKKSEYTHERRSYYIKKMVLDRDILKEIPLERRLAFRLRESPGYYLYHKAIVDAITATSPTGVYFQNIEEFDDF